MKGGPYSHPRPYWAQWPYIKICHQKSLRPLLLSPPYNTKQPVRFEGDLAAPPSSNIFKIGFKIWILTKIKIF